MGVQRDSISAIPNFKKAYDSLRKEVLFSIIIGVGVAMKLIRLIKICSKVHVIKHLIIFLCKTAKTKEMLYHYCF
jgi:hypothetical protein